MKFVDIWLLIGQHSVEQQHGKGQQNGVPIPAATACPPNTGHHACQHCNSMHQTLQTYRLHAHVLSRPSVVTVCQAIQATLTWILDKVKPTELGRLLKIKRQQAYTVLRSDELGIPAEECIVQECRSTVPTAMTGLHSNRAADRAALWQHAADYVSTVTTSFTFKYRHNLHQHADRTEWLN